jgi:hypothetical protein
MDNNKYKLQIQTNWYKTPDQYQGNGGESSYVKGCLIADGCPNKYFKIYPMQVQFYLYIGENPQELALYSILRVSGSDLYSGYEVVPKIYFKYVNQLLDSFIEANPTYTVKIKQDENI